VPLGLLTAAPLRGAGREIVTDGEILTGAALIAFGGAQTGGQAHQAPPDPHQRKDTHFGADKTWTVTVPALANGGISHGRLPSGSLSGGALP
jgi:hypothetical protein